MRPSFHGGLPLLTCLGLTAVGLVAPVGSARAQSPPADSAPSAALQVPPPVEAEDSLSRIHLPEGFRVELAAAEPLLFDPVAFDWDAQGRLWVIEMADYPEGIDGQGAPGGRLRRLEDSDGDGRYDQAVLVAEGLNFPTGVLCWREGVLVTAAPEILFLADRDGDGKAEHREVLIRGFHEGNQQLRVNGLRWGLDNWVYCAIGAHTAGYGKEAELTSLRNGQTLAIGARDFRFRPDTGEIDPQSGPTQFGRNRDDWGHWFGSQNSWPLWHYVLHDHYLRRNPHFAAPSPRHDLLRPANPKVYPVSPPMKRYHSFHQAGHFTAACAGMIYRDQWLFSDPEAVQAFVCEPAGNLVQSHRLVDEGVTFRAERFPGGDHHDFFASEDPWCRPVMVRTGPDGALWVADMYRYMIEHPHWLPQEGRDELLPYYRLGEDRGRIYRIVPEKAEARRLPRLDQWKGPALVAALDSPNGWVRDQGQRLLFWQGAGDEATVGALRALQRESANPLARLHALATLDGLGVMQKEDLLLGLQDSHPGVQEHALRLAEREEATPALLAAVAALRDTEDPKLRLQLAFTLGAWQAPEAGEILASLMPAAGKDSWLEAAILSSAVPHATRLAEAVSSLGEDGEIWNEPLWSLLLGLGERDALAAMLQGVLEAVDGRYLPAQMRQAESFLRLLQGKSTGLGALREAAADALTEGLGRFATLWEQAEALARDESAAPADRLAAASLWGLAPGKEAEAVALLTQWLHATTTEAATLREVIAALARFPKADITTQFAQAWPSLTPENRITLLDEWLSREPWAHDFLQRLQRGELSIAEIDATRRSRLLHHPSKRIKELAEALFHAAGNPARAEVVEKYRPALSLEGDVQKGHTIYLAYCSSCHPHGREGVALGPDLASVADHPAEKLLANILDPNLDIQPGYQAYACRLKGGGDLFGIIASETAHSITLKQPDGSSRVLLRQDIASLTATGVSLMPEGLEAAISIEDMAHLLQFIRRTPPKP